MRGFHGGGAPARLTIAPPGTTAFAAGRPLQGFGAFHYFGGQIPGVEVFAPFGTDEDGAEKTLALFGRLNRSLRLKRTLSELESREGEWANKRVPAGYTYLLQLIGHDLVHTAEETPEIDFSGQDTRNQRGQGLDLETIFGGGPAVCPFAYRPPDVTRSWRPQDAARVELRLGDFRDGRPETRASTEAPDGRELARSAFVPSEGPPGALQHGWRDVHVADPRNEDNTIIAQLTALLHRTHNDIARRIEAEGLDAADDEGERRMLRSALARGTLRRLYREIVRHDVLPRLLHPEIHRIYEANPDAELLDEPGARGSQPLEFAYVVGRIGHFMVRPTYRLNAGRRVSLKGVIETSARRAPGVFKTPPTQSWKIDWRLFFPPDEAAARSAPALYGVDVNWAAQLSAHMAEGFLNDQLFEVEGLTASSLFMQDLVRATSALSASMKGALRVIKHRASVNGALAGLSLQLPDADEASAQMKAFAERLLAEDQGGLTAEDAALLALDAPLALHLLAEAEAEGGAHLGVTGSIILADVCRRALGPSPAGAEAAWDARIDGVTRRLFAGRAPATMADLIRRTVGYDDDIGS